MDYTPDQVENDEVLLQQATSLMNDRVHTWRARHGNVADDEAEFTVQCNAVDGQPAGPVWLPLMTSAQVIDHLVTEHKFDHNDLEDTSWDKMLLYAFAAWPIDDLDIDKRSESDPHFIIPPVGPQGQELHPIHITNPTNAKLAFKVLYVLPGTDQVEHIGQGVLVSLESTVVFIGLPRGMLTQALPAKVEIEWVRAMTDGPWIPEWHAETPRRAVDRDHVEFDYYTEAQRAASAAQAAQQAPNANIQPAPEAIANIPFMPNINAPVIPPAGNGIIPINLPGYRNDQADQEDQPENEPGPPDAKRRRTDNDQ